MPQSSLTTMLNQFAQSVARLFPGAEPDRESSEWIDSDSSWHNSSHDLASGLKVVEHFEPLQVFPDTLPAFHYPPATQALAR